MTVSTGKLKVWGRKVKVQPFLPLCGGIWSRAVSEMPEWLYHCSTYHTGAGVLLLPGSSLAEFQPGRKRWQVKWEEITSSFWESFTHSLRLSPAFQRMDPEDRTIICKHFMTIFKCKYFLLSLHLTQTCIKHLEVTSYCLLLATPSDSVLFVFTITVHWCFHSPLKMPV